jgi:hypothetical protein
MAGTSANIFSRCLPAAGTNIETCGAITACNAVPLQSGDLSTIYGNSDSTYKILGNLISADFVGKAVGVKLNGMYDFLQANKRVLGGKRLSVQQVAGGVWEISPFIKMGRKRPVNSEYWTVRIPAGTGATPNQESNITVRFYSQGSIPTDARWFPTGMRVFIAGGTSADAGSAVNEPGGASATGDTIYRLAYSVSSVSGTGTDNNGAYVTVVLTPQNMGSYFLASDRPDAIKSKSKLPGNLAAEANSNGGAVLGLAVRGTPNVSDFESFCGEIPALNTNQLIPFWIETTRYSICEDELTQKYLAALRDSNPFFKQFGDVEQVEINRQIIEDFQRRHANNFFFNKPIGPNQTLANYNQLSAINTASSGALNVPAEGRCIGRRANATGVYEQLAECGRVSDLQGEKLNLQILFNTLYQLQRDREAVGVKSDVIELFTDSFFANQIVSGMVNYFKTKYGADVFRLVYQLNQGGDQGPFGFRFYKFELDYPQVELRIVTHRFFDDYLAAHKAAGSENAGRALWALDFNNIYQGIIDANSVVNKTGDLKALAAVDDTYRCVMKVPTRSTKLNSITYTAVVETETTSFVLENFNSSAPVVTGEWGTSTTYI